MFKQIIQFLLFAIIHGQVCPSDQYFYKDQCILKTCEPFIAKLTSNTKPSGQRFLTLNFNGTIVKKEQFYQFELAFDDDENGTFYRDNNSSCIIDQLYQHNLNYVEEVLDNTNITSSYSKNVRKWSFPISNLSTLYIDNQKDKRVNNGYYTLRFYVGKHLLLIYLFDFQLIIDLKDNLIETHFNSQILDDQEACNILQNCEQLIQSEIVFCTNKDCSEFIETPQLIVNNQTFFIQQITSEFQNWYIHDIEFAFQSSQIVKKFRPFLEQTEPGRTMARIEPTFISGPGTLYFTAKVSQSNFWGRRALEQKIGRPLSLGKVQIGCIKQSTDSQCPTDQEIQDFNKLDCGDVDLMYCGAQLLLFIGLAIWVI